MRIEHNYVTRMVAYLSVEKISKYKDKQTIRTNIHVIEEN